MNYKPGDIVTYVGEDNPPRMRKGQKYRIDYVNQKYIGFYFGNGSANYGLEAFERNFSCKENNVLKILKEVDATGV